MATLKEQPRTGRDESVEEKQTRRILSHDGLINRIIEGGIEVKRGRGRKRQQMIDDNMDKEKYGY